MGDKFNENLRIAREKRNMTQKELADIIGVAKSTYSLYESGNREPNVQTIKRIADALSVSADTLLGLNIEPITMAAHFDGNEYTEDELEDIRNYAEFIRHKRNEAQQSKVTQLPDRSYLEPVAAHDRTDIDVTDEMCKHDDALMDNDDEWK